MPQAATIKSLPRAFRMMKTLQARDLEDYRRAGALALKLEGRMAAEVDRRWTRWRATGATAATAAWLMTSWARSSSASRARGAGDARRAAHIE